MTIQFDGAELTEAGSNMTALAARFPSLTWTYNTDNAAEVRYQGALPAPYNGEGHEVQLAIPIASDGSFTYTTTGFYFIADGNLRLALPEPDTATRTLMISITEVGDWLEGFIDNMT